MIFNSFNFWIVFPFIFCLYWLIPCSKPSAKKIFLIAVSYLLYMNYKPIYALLLLGITFVTYAGALIIEKVDIENTLSRHKRKCLITFLVVLTLFPLLLFKYYNFINTIITNDLEFIGLRFELPGLNWMVPLGISFYSFMAVGYLWDVYYGKIKAEHNWCDYMLFVSFFPQVVSGPIGKAESLLPQFKTPKPFSFEAGIKGLKYLIWGLFLKLVIADRIGTYVDLVYSNYEHFSGVNCLIVSVFYSVQIYGDFAGYSLMALGIAKMLQVDVINNFNRPYFAVSVTDFWRRWHISLTKWLVTYIYIPLGGNRCSKIRNYINILITFLVSGIWHGANWTFIIWGIIHGFLQIIEKFFGFAKVDSKNKLLITIRISITFFLVNIAWIFFRMPSVGEAFGVITHIFRDFEGSVLSNINNSTLFLIILGIFILFLKELIEEFGVLKFKILCNKCAEGVVLLILLSMILCVGVLDSGQFIYANF